MSQRVASASATVRWARVAAFYGLTVAITTAAALAWRGSGRRWQGTEATLALNACMLVPGLVALVLTRWVFHEPLAATLALRRPTVRWLLTAWLLPALVMLLALGVALVLPGHAFSREMQGLRALGLSGADIDAMRSRLPSSATALVAATLVQGLLVGPTLCLVGGLGEELGWRGWLHHELEPLGSPARAVVVGVSWGTWHLPLVLQGYAYPEHPALGSVMLLALTQVLAHLYARLRERSGSVFVPAVFHGTCSGTGVVAAAFVSGGTELTSGFTGLAGVAASALVTAVFLAVTPRRR